MPIFSKNSKKENRAAGQFPHRQLFKPENIVESIFVGLSICSVLALILSNINSVFGDSIKTIVPQFISSYFREITHVMHICLISYVLFVMRKMYEDIREIRPHKDDIKREDGQETYLARWQRWINENIDFLKDEKEKYGCYDESVNVDKNKNEDRDRYRQKINYRIKVANANMKATHTLWICVWATWLLMYISLFASGFMEHTFAHPAKQTRKIDTKIIVQDTAVYTVKKITQGNTSRVDTISQIVGSEMVIPLVNAYETIDKKSHFLKSRRDSLSLGYIITPNPDNDSNYKKEKEEEEEKEKLKKLFMCIENALGHIVNFFMFLMFFMYQFSYSGAMAFAELKRKEREKDWKTKKLRKTKNLWENIQIMWACILYKLWNFFGSIEIPEESIIKDDKHLKEELKNTGSFIVYFIVVLGFTCIIIFIDHYLIYSDQPFYSFYAQLIVSALTCISMMFLFGQLNNGKLRLPGMAVGVMFFYAAIQLFSPFRDREIMQPIGFLNKDTFDFIITTLCFIAKFMVFFIIRWMFTGGRLAYCFFDRAIKFHPETIRKNQEMDEKLYEAIFE